MNRNFAEWMNPANWPKHGKLPESGEVDCHTSQQEREEQCPFIVQPNGAIQVKREVILQAMKESGFSRIDSCCYPELNKMCENDQYKGNLEGFVNRLMKLIGVSPSN